MFVFEKLRKISTSFGFYTWIIEGETFRRRWGLGIWNFWNIFDYKERTLESKRKTE